MCLEDKPFKCDSCDKSFRHNLTLIRHIKAHSEGKKYHCDLCSKDFSRSDSFQRHQKLHTGEKPFRCETCGKSFNRNDYLQKHMKTHTLDDSQYSYNTHNVKSSVPVGVTTDDGPTNRSNVFGRREKNRLIVDYFTFNITCFRNTTSTTIANIR